MCELGKKEAEPREKAYDEEEYQWVGYREQEACDEIAPVVGGFYFGGL